GGHIGVASRRIHRAGIAFLSFIRIDHSVTAHPAHLATHEVAGAGWRPVVTAVVALFARVHLAVSAFLRRQAVVAALIEDELLGVIRIRVTIDDVTVVADLALVLVDDAVAAAADVDAHRLVGRALLALLAAHAEL